MEFCRIVGKLMDEMERKKAWKEEQKAGYCGGLIRLTFWRTC
jgi:hypothetical protein